MKRCFHRVFLQVFLIIALDIIQHQTEAGKNVIDLPDDVDATILAERQRLQALPNHYVGKVDCHGTSKHEGTKPEKPERVANPQLLTWCGDVKVLRGTMPTDPPEVIQIPPNIATASSYTKGCLKSGKQYPAGGYTRISEGPVKEGLAGADFEPCSERVRGLKFLGRKLGTMGNRRKRSETYSFPSMLWQKPTVPYMFHQSVTEEVREVIELAIREYRDKTCIAFAMVEGTSYNGSHILFASQGSSCSTDRLGPNPYPPFATKIDVALCGKSKGSIIHEIAHALGLSHSQKRVDRDKSVKVYLPNIVESWASQFSVDPSQYFDNWGVPYYYDSVMHYFPYAATRNGLMTICPLDPLMETVMGQRETLAFGDLALINRIYCRESCFNRDELKTVQFTDNVTRTISGRLCQNWSSQSPHKHKFTSVGDHNSCRNPDGWDGGPWCYTTDPTARYEPCFSSCESLKKPAPGKPVRPSCNGWCYNGGYHHPKSCTCMCPPYTSGERCETKNDTAMYDHIKCGGKIDLKKIGDKVTIATPGYPSNYAEKSFCMWWIRSPNNSQIKLTVGDFLLEVPDSTGCYDYLEVRPSVCASAIERPEKMRFCGNSLSKAAGGSASKQLHSDDNNMVLKFYSDETLNAKGFSLTAEAIAATK